MPYLQSQGYSCYQVLALLGCLRLVGNCWYGSTSRPLATWLFAIDSNMVNAATYSKRNPHACICHGVQVHDLQHTLETVTDQRNELRQQVR